MACNWTGRVGEQLLEVIGLLAGGEDASRLRGMVLWRGPTKIKGVGELVRALPGWLVFYHRIGTNEAIMNHRGTLSQLTVA